MKPISALFILIHLAIGTTAFAKVDVTKGEKIFKRCEAFLHVGGDAKNGVRPTRCGVIGKTVETNEGFKYSGTMNDYSADRGARNDATLGVFLADPKGTVPGTKMTLKALKKVSNISDVVAYIATTG